MNNKSTIHVAKIVQLDARVGFIFADSSGSSSCIVISLNVKPLLVDRNTGETIRACIDRTWSSYPSVLRLLSQVPNEVNLISNDGALQNDRCEASYCTSKRRGASRIRLPCAVHCAHRGTGCLYDTMPSEISGVVN